MVVFIDHLHPNSCLLYCIRGTCLGVKLSRLFILLSQPVKYMLLSSLLPVCLAAIASGTPFSRRDLSPQLAQALSDAGIDDWKVTSKPKNVSGAPKVRSYTAQIP
jgi:hypothetical protein